MCYSTRQHHQKPKMFQPAPLKIKRIKELENCYYSESLQLPTQQQLRQKNQWQIILWGHFWSMWRCKSGVSQNMTVFLSFLNWNIPKPIRKNCKTSFHESVLPVKSCQLISREILQHILLFVGIFWSFLISKNKICSCRIEIPWNNFCISVSDYF